MATHVLKVFYYSWVARILLNGMTDKVVEYIEKNYNKTY